MTLTTRMLPAAALALLSCAPMYADDNTGGFALNAPDLNASLRKQPTTTEAAEPAPIAAKASHPNFGDEGSRWWTIYGGVAYDFSDATDFAIGGDFSYFLSRNVEFAVELNAWYFDQRGPDAFGLNPEMIFRWHFYNEGRLTLYGDLGIGLLFATDEVPSGGTEFDFMPRAGGGLTYALTEDLSGPRLQLGVRWHHISNGRINGDADNPSRDGLMVYTGVIFRY